MENVVKVKKPKGKITKSDKNFRMFRKILFSDMTQHPADIALQAYNCKSRNVAYVIASQCLKKLKLSMSELLDRQGLTDLHDIESLKRLRTAKDKTFITVKDSDGNETIKVRSVDNHHIQYRALKLTQKLKGRLLSGGPVVNIDNRVQYAKIDANDLNSKSRKEIVDIILGRTNGNHVDVSDT